METFSSLPLYYQYKLIKLLPKCDQELTPQGWLQPSATALNNEYFTKAHRHWAKQLKESKLNSDFVQKCKADLEKGRQSLDPFKVKHFEPVWAEPLNSRTHLDEIIEREQRNRLNQKTTKDQENRNLCELNLKLKRDEEMNQKLRKEQEQKAAIYLSTISTDNRPKPATTPKRRNTRPSSRRTKESTFQTPTKCDQMNFSSNSTETSPLSVGSITVKKGVGSSPIPNWTGFDQSPTNGKIFYISSNGKLLQIQPTVQQPTESTSDQTNTRKRRIDLDDSGIASLNGISYGTPVLGGSQSQPAQLLTNFLTVPCECDQRPLVNCSRCKAFCHPDCAQSSTTLSTLCSNCL